MKIVRSEVVAFGGDLPVAAGNAQLIELPPFPNAERSLLDQYAKAFEKVMASARQIAEGWTSGALRKS